MVLVPRWGSAVANTTRITTNQIMVLMRTVRKFISNLTEKPLTNVLGMISTIEFILNPLNI